MLFTITTYVQFLYRGYNSCSMLSIKKSNNLVLFIFMFLKIFFKIWNSFCQGKSSLYQWYNTDTFVLRSSLRCNAVSILDFSYACGIVACTQIFTSSFRYIYGILSLNKTWFGDYLHLISPCENFLRFGIAFVKVRVLSTNDTIRISLFSVLLWDVTLYQF
jgi:hypothetical protein